MCRIETAAVVVGDVESVTTDHRDVVWQARTPHAVIIHCEAILCRKLGEKEIRWNRCWIDFVRTITLKDKDKDPIETKR